MKRKAAWTFRLTGGGVDLGVPARAATGATGAPLRVWLFGEKNRARFLKEKDSPPLPPCTDAAPPRERGCFCGLAK